MFNKKKFLRRALSTFLISGSLFFMPVASAEIYAADGEYTMSKYETVDVAEQRAIKDAMRHAQEQAGVYIESYSRMNNFQLLEDEIITIASGVLKFAEKPNITKTLLEDGSIKIFAAIKVEISDGDLEKYLSNSLENRQQVNAQLESLRQANAAQSQRIKILEAQIANVKTPQDEIKLKSDFDAEGKIFFSNQKVEEGTKFWNEKNYNKALELFDEAVELNPDNAETYCGRGKAYGELKQYAAALADLNKAVELNPNYAEAYNNRGKVYFESKKYDAAISDFSKAIELLPNYIKAYVNRAETYSILNNYDAAISDFSKVLELNSKNFAVCYKRGMAYNSLKNYTAALSDFNKAVRLNPNFAEAYNARGTVYYNLKQYDAAISDYTKTIEIKPDYGKAYSNRAEAYRALGDYENYRKDLNSMMKYTVRPIKTTR